MSTQNFVERARAIGGLVRERAGEAEAQRSLTDDVVAAMQDQGLLRMWVPTAYDGHEVPVIDAIDTMVELGRHDGAAAWCTMIANTTALLAARLPAEYAAELFGHPGAIGAGFAQPRGLATEVDGGLRITGQWQWGSFTRHATIVGAGARLENPTDTSPRVPFVFFDPEDVEWIDNWDVLGLSGTGSSDYTTTDAFVPEGRWVDFGRAPIPLVDTPLYRFSFYGLLAIGVAATVVGMADRAVSEFADSVSDRIPQGSTRPLAERAATQAEAARAEATVRSSIAFIHDVAGGTWDRACEGEPMTEDDRRLLRLAAADATQRCGDAVSRLYRVGGGEAVYKVSGLEKLFRDVNVATQHAMVAPRTFELPGRMRLGLETDTRQL